MIILVLSTGLRTRNLDTNHCTVSNHPPTIVVHHLSTIVAVAITFIVNFTHAIIKLIKSQQG